jgi:hypothetical protein
MSCPHCSEALAERGSFCKACGGQAKCLSCREVLEPGAMACVECGTRVGQLGEGVRESVPQAAPALSSNRNTLSYSEDRNSRKFEAALTDSAMHGLGDVFGELFAQRGVGRVTLPAGTRTLIRDVTTGETKQLPAFIPEPEEIVIPVQKTPQSVEKEKLLNVFTINGETLELADNRLKAKSAADYYKRLTYLFIYAQDLLLGHTLTPKNELLVVLKEAKVYDANCRFWLKQKKGFTVDSEDRMKLIAGAREHAAKALDEILDTNIVDDWNPDTKAAKPRAAKKKASK